MNIISVCALAIASAVIFITLKPKNGEIALMLGISASVLILISTLSQVSQVISSINNIVAQSNIKNDYVIILLKVTGICLITEFAVNTCRDSGNQALAGNISLAGKIAVTIVALPLYSEILNTVISLLQG